MQLPFPDARFDAVVCLHVLHHLTKPRRGLEEMLRVLRPGGRLLIAEPHASLSMRLALAVTRHESVDWGVDPFGPATCQTKGDGNNAIPDLMFGNLARFLREFPGLTVEHDRFVEWLTFLNSGGVSHRTPHVPLPQFALAWCGWLDERLMALERVFAMGRELVFRKGA
jgi:SAM-dependent methyltransferase